MKQLFSWPFIFIFLSSWMFWKANYSLISIKGYFPSLQLQAYQCRKILNIYRICHLQILLDSFRMLHIYPALLILRKIFLLYPRHLCRGVYSFRLSVRPFVCSFVRLFVRSFVLPSVAWNLRQSFALKFLKWCISQQLLIRKHSYFDHSYPGWLAFTP